MKYAVEAKVFDNGRMVARVRPARDGEERRRSHAGTNNDPSARGAEGTTATGGNEVVYSTEPAYYSDSSS